MSISAELPDLQQAVAVPRKPERAGSTEASSLTKIYAGALINGRRSVTVQNDQRTRPLVCHDFFTPDFAWGYHGGAPDELAIAILHDHFGSPRAVIGQRVLGLYRDFADEVVAKLARDRRWSLPAGFVPRWVHRREEAVTSA